MAVSLDRFLPPEAGPHRPVVDECAQCGAEIEAGDEVCEFDGTRFCDCDCLYDFVQAEARLVVVE